MSGITLEKSIQKPKLKLQKLSNINLVLNKIKENYGDSLKGQIITPERIIGKKKWKN